MKEYIVAIRYFRQGMECFDIYHNINENKEMAIKTIKEDWHKRNDHLFFENKESAEFFIKIDEEK